MLHIKENKPFLNFIIHYKFRILKMLGWNARKEKLGKKGTFKREKNLLSS